MNAPFHAVEKEVDGGRSSSCKTTNNPTDVFLLQWINHLLVICEQGWINAKLKHDPSIRRGIHEVRNSARDPLEMSET